ADAPRAATEVSQRRVERVELRIQATQVSARLAQLLLLPPVVGLFPAEPAVVPVVLVPTDGPLEELVALGWRNRPELAEYQARVGAEVAAAAQDARLRATLLADAQEAVRQALETWRRLKEANFGLAGPNPRYDPLEPLIAEQQLNNARNQYLAEVIAFNRAQF